MNNELNQYVSVQNREELSRILDYLFPADRENLTRIIKEACESSKGFGFCDGLAAANMKGGLN